ncbi:MAG: glycosyltransferase family 39 protein [Actinomycetota bacterium]|nr:glycosyltransferase family 39 protein [Actinomycetota bacterium]
MTTATALPPQQGVSACAVASPPQPRWVTWALLALLAGTAALYSWNTAAGGYSDYYATAAKSMSESWKAFFFGSFDPQATITLDKLAGFLIPQALSARIFGFSPASLAVPQIIEGLITILASYLILRKWAGWAAGLGGALIMASTPLLVSMFSHPMEDGMLTMCTTLAILTFQHSLDTHRTVYLMLAGALVGLGFQAKMMQAWLILPALAGVYLIVHTGPLTRKIRDLLFAAAATVSVSLSWMTAIALIPAAARPYIDGSTNNNIFSMVFGYNGFDRFIRGLVPGALGADPGVHPNPGSAAATAPALVTHTPVKLLMPLYAGQIGWLYPLALAGVVLGLVYLHTHRSAPGQGTQLKSGVLLSTALLVSVGSILSVMDLPHAAYLAALTFPLAALAAIGAKLLWHNYAHSSGHLRYALPACVLLQSVWAAALSAPYPGFAPWLAPTIVTTGTAATAVLLRRASRGRASIAHGTARRRSTRAALGLAGCAVLAGPLVWSLSTLNPAHAGTANEAHAGPYTASADARARMTNTLDGGIYGIGLASNRAVSATTAAETAMYRYAVSHSGTTPYAIATDSWRSAAPLILQGGQRVLPIGGYSARIPTPTAAEIRNLVATGSLKYILLTGDGAKSGNATPNIDTIQQWVQRRCSRLPPTAYLQAPKPGDLRSPVRDSLYQCRTSPNLGPR